MDNKDKLRRIKHDPSFYMQSFLKIRTKQGKLEKLTLNSTQRKINERIDELQGKPIRILVLKARQMGVSTYTEGRIFHRSATTKLTNSLIIAHKEDASTNLFNMSKLFYEELPPPLRPMKKASNAKELIFENPTPDPVEKQKNPGLRSKIKIDTAKNLGAGRSDTIHNLHASEVAFWDNAETVMLGLLQSVPNTPNTMIIIESTANGVGGYFYDLWQQAKNGENDFIPLFFPWFEHEEYRMPVSDGFVLTGEEQELKSQYNLDNEQLAWRRWAIRNNCNGDPQLFSQEYPSNDMEAFLVSGRPRFDMPTLMEYLNQCEDGQRGYLERVGSTLKFIPDPKGYIEVWDTPQRGKEYFIGGDVAKGLVTGDYSAAPVYNADKNLVALWHGHIDPDLFADQIVTLGLYYNEALLAPEENNHGLTVINKAKQEYWNIYKRTTHDKVTDETKEQLGWYTTEQSKKLAIDNLAKLVRERRIGIKSKKFVQELMTYIIEDDGKTNAQEGSHDDIVMASAIILFVMDQFTTEVPMILQAGTRINKSSNWVGGRHISEIEDDQDEESEWLRGWRM